MERGEVTNRGETSCEGEAPPAAPQLEEDARSAATESLREPAERETAGKEQGGDLKATHPLDRFAWFDLRPIPEQLAVDLVNTLARHNYQGLLLTAEQASTLSTDILKVGVLEPSSKLSPEEATRLYDVLLLEDRVSEGHGERYRGCCGGHVGVLVRVVDMETLERACAQLGSVDYLVLSFQDETKIPLELVLAHAAKHEARVVTMVGHGVEAEVVLGVLEQGSHGVLFASMEMDQMISVGEAVAGRSTSLRQPLTTLTVVETRHVGMGDRGCVDTCSYLGLDEGLLVGSFSRGGILVCSETHPLPYMPTRPFRVNSGALHSYVLAPGGRTWYLSDLRAGMELLAVRTDGSARKVVTGRVKIERRPLLQIRALNEERVELELTVQEDWHVRVFSSQGAPLNVTSLRQGDELLGYTAHAARHVGLPVSEWIVEQ
jgi:3-amino-4-hydroxybenzoic acid synthase